MRERRNVCLSIILAVAALGLLFPSAGWARDAEKILYAFTGLTDGGYPYAGPILDSKGNLYGTTYNGGTSYCGTVFELIPSSSGTWTEQVLYSFTGCTGATQDGSQPFGGLVFDKKGNLYGTTLNGGNSFAGTVFELSPESNGTWTEKVLYNFTGGIDGGYPEFGLTLDAVGNLYGITYAGGAKGFGSVFELAMGSNGTWSEKTLYSFTGGNDGAYPGCSLTFDTVGNLYGTTQFGGVHDYGVVFELSRSTDAWKEEVIHAFTGGAGGASPNAGVVLDKAGNVYAEATFSVLELSPVPGGTWTAASLHDFTGGSDGASAYGALTTDNAGNLYGMTYSGGKHRGTVFELSPGQNGAWTETILHSFTGGSDGQFPYFNYLSIDASGRVYGTTQAGGPSNQGVVFQITP